MNLSDPFGRKAARKEKEYASFSATLREAGVDSEEQVHSLISDAQRRRKKSIIVAVAITMLLALVFPDVRLFILPLGVLFCFWVLKITTNGQIYLRRYIEEELSDKAAPEEDREQQ